MKIINAFIGGADRPIHVYERPEDASAFWDFLKVATARPIAVDSETNGLDPYAPSFKLRLVQFGTMTEAWVIPYRADTHDLIAEGLEAAPALIAHNAGFDLLVFEAMGLLDLDDGWRKSVDTRIMAHLLDPRSAHEGGIGHKLELLANAYFETNAERFQDDLFEVFRANKWKREDGYGLVGIDCPEYLRYAGVDVLLASRIFDAMKPLVATRFSELSAFEHEIGRICSGFERKGMLVDRHYATELIDHYAEIEVDAKHIAKGFGITKLGSTAQVSQVLMALGAELTEKTPGGELKVDKKILEALADNNAGEPLGVVAEAVLVGKNAAKWSSAYVSNTLDRLDANGRVHPSIKALEARTARMSVSAPPLQQLPAGDWRVRSMFVAEPGHSYFSVDYSQVELRVLAALSEEPTMLKAINAGEDLHDTTARLFYGDDFTKAQRKLAKNVNFGEVFGGGAKTLARQAGVNIAEAQSAKQKFRRAYPAITKYSARLKDRAEFGKVAVVTASGRELPLDRDRLYSCTNYTVQSTARDVLGQALIYLDQEDLTQYVNLPIHDEVLGQAPIAEVEEIVREIERVMTMPFLGAVELTAEGEIYGESWGAGYR